MGIVTQNVLNIANDLTGSLLLSSNKKWVEVTLGGLRVALFVWWCPQFLDPDFVSKFHVTDDETDNDEQKY